MNFPPDDESLLAPDRVKYVGNLLQALFLLLALPYLVLSLLRHPAFTMKGATVKHAAAVAG